MYYMLKIFTIHDDYNGVVNLELLSLDLKKRLIDSVEHGLKNGSNYGEILDGSKEEIEELLEQHLISPVNFPHYIEAIVEFTSDNVYF